MAVSRVNQRASKSAAHNSSRGIVVDFTGAIFDRAPSNEVVGLPDESITLRYTTAAYPVIDASQNPHSEYCMPRRVPINRGMRTHCKLGKSATKLRQSSALS